MRNSLLHIIPVVISLYVLFGFALTTSSLANHGNQQGNGQMFSSFTGEIANDISAIYLPLIQNTAKPVRQVNAPYFDGDLRGDEAAIFWFGQVNPTKNYADVRVGYNDEILYIHVAVFDRRLWYDETPSIVDLTAWDAVSLFLNMDGDTGNAPGVNSYKFIGQLNWWESREDWQVGYRGNGSDWVADPAPFTTTSGWRGNAPNDDMDDRGWTMTFHIPFESLGLSGTPHRGSIWGMALILHDRDGAPGTPIADKTWPENININRPQTWGQLAFGLPTYTPPIATQGGEVEIRHGLNGTEVKDAHVGGHSTCGRDYWPNFFNGWGDANFAGSTQINIQNQWDVADWPCFSKYFVTFPLDAVPQGKAILSATLYLHQFGGSDPTQAQPSLIQVLTVSEDWDETTLTWNNAPYATENVSRAWVDPLPDYPGEPGVPREWDVSKAVAEAYAFGEPLRLVLYSADWARHSGKYFYSSDAGEAARPLIKILWGDP